MPILNSSSVRVWSARARRTVAAFTEAPMAVPKTAAWTIRAFVAVRRALRRRHLTAADLPPVPAAPLAAEVAVNAVLVATRATCLTRSIIRQEWLAAQGDMRDLVIGVTGTTPEFRAHAWVQGDPAWTSAGYVEILRRSPGEQLVPPADESAFD